jgi:hypothetical protein
VLEGDLDALPALLAAVGHGDVRFDLILGRNSLTQQPDKAAAARLLADLARPGALLSLGEAIPRHGQRLYALFEEAARGEWAGALGAARRPSTLMPATPGQLGRRRPGRGAGRRWLGGGGGGGL